MLTVSHSRSVSRDYAHSDALSRHPNSLPVQILRTALMAGGRKLSWGERRKQFWWGHFRISVCFVCSTFGSPRDAGHRAALCSGLTSPCKPSAEASVLSLFRAELHFERSHARMRSDLLDLLSAFWRNVSMLGGWMFFFHFVSLRAAQKARGSLPQYTAQCILAHSLMLFNTVTSARSELTPKFLSAAMPKLGS
jgi:hypothetical protein